VGYPQGEIPMLDVRGAAVSGPTLPASAWRLFMERALAGTPNLAFAAPESPSLFTAWTGPHAYRVTESAPR
jgi:hypothetical protein